MVLAARRESELQQVVSACNALVKDSAIGKIADVADRAANEALVKETVAHFGRLDVIVLNAGMSAGAPFEQVNEDGLTAFENLTKINYFGPVYLTKYALPEIIKNKGRIVVISSIFGFHGGPTRTFYCGSKFALHGFFESLRLEVADKDVKVTIVCPGAVATDIARTRVGPDGKPAKIGHFDMKQALSSEKAAEFITDALQRGQRLRTFSRMTTLLYHVQTFFPHVWDKIFISQMIKLKMLEEPSVLPSAAHH